MKPIIVFGVGLLLLAGCVTGDGSDDVGMRHSADNPYYNYSAAMTSTSQVPLGSTWQREHAGEIDKATCNETLIGFIESPQAADALLARIRPAYETDPIVLHQVAAVTQFVRNPKYHRSAEFTARWVAALERAVARHSDPYVKTLLKQQLRLCK